MTRRSSRDLGNGLRNPLRRALSSTFLLPAFLVTSVLITAAQSANAQANPQAGPYERAYAQSKNVVEKALKVLQPSLSGRLPVVEGFALPGNYPLSRYQRAYYQAAVQVNSTASGGSVVRVSTKLTAWYADSVPSRSGYQLLTSNGRIESDLLDQLSEALAGGSSAMSSKGSSHGSSSDGLTATHAPAAPAKAPAAADSGTAEPTISAPMPRLPETGRGFSSSLEQGLSTQVANSKNSASTPAAATDPRQTALQAEAASLEEVLKNRAHPKNLVAIKKSGTPVVAAPSLTAKTLFMASEHDEFEMLDFNADWVHVRISGLSRGWIWRTSLEMPQGISDVPLAGANAAPVVADMFQVTREETAPFPGDWVPLRGKNVKIISVQKIQENEKNSGPQAKLEYAKSLLDKSYAELAARSQELAGVVLIFDSVDGGLIAATFPTVRQWKAGALSDSALWHQCYFDPPETFKISTPSGAQ
ncbi:MAG: hypothetical protein WB566_13825 [Terriglobales bacterium]